MANVSDRKRFTCGDCHILAHAICRLTDWKFCTFQWRGGGADAHAFVQMPDGRFLDIEGVKTHEEMMTAWKQKAPDQTIRVWEDGEINEKHPTWGTNGLQGWPGSRERAEKVARNLLWRSNPSDTSDAVTPRNPSNPSNPSDTSDAVTPSNPSDTSDAVTPRAPRVPSKLSPASYPSVLRYFILNMAMVCPAALRRLAPRQRRPVERSRSACHMPICRGFAQKLKSLTPHSYHITAIFGCFGAKTLVA